MLEISNAKQKLQQVGKKLQQTKIDTINIRDCFKRRKQYLVLAEDIYSPINIPPFTKSLMDGYAIKCSQLEKVLSNISINNNTDITINVLKTIVAGDAIKNLKADTKHDNTNQINAIRIFTGALMPKDYDAVIMQEDIIRSNDKQMSSLSINTKLVQKYKIGTNVLQKAADFKNGELVFKKGSKLDSLQLSVIAGLGINEVKIYKSLKIAVLTNGNELVEPGKKLKKGKIYNSNKYLISYFLQDFGFHVNSFIAQNDDLAKLKTFISEKAEQFDLLISSGGVSVGDKDYLIKAIKNLGELEVYKLKMQPGKPLALASIKCESKKQSTPILALPGNPISTYVSLLILGIDFIKILQGEKYISSKLPITKLVYSNFNLVPSFRDRFIGVKLDKGTANLLPTQISSMFHSILDSDGLVYIKGDTKVVIGDNLEFISFKEFH